MIYQYKIKKRLSDADIFAVWQLASGNWQLASGNWQLEDSVLMEEVEEVEEVVRSGRSVGEG